MKLLRGEFDRGFTLKEARCLKAVPGIKIIKLKSLSFNNFCRNSTNYHVLGNHGREEERE